MSSVKTATSSRRKSKGRTFQCMGYPDCNMTFTRSEHLARHIRKHTGERPFECVHCARKFSRLDNLRQHKQTVHAHEQLFLSYGKPLPALPHEAQEQLKKNQITHQEIITQSKQNSLPQGSANLLKPTQFRSKRRPKPLALSRVSVFNDAPCTAPTPRSSDSQNFILSPVSPGHQTQLPMTANLPSFQFLTTQSIRDSTYSNHSSIRDSTYSNHSFNSNHDSLVSPYNSSFTSYSNSTTPVNFSFETGVNTPTNLSFETSFKPSINSQFSMNATTNHTGIIGSRRSWLNNVLNSNSSNELNHSSDPIPENQHSPVTNGKRLRIESLLNSSDRNKRLPPVDNLGIETANRI